MRCPCGCRLLFPGMVFFSRPACPLPERGKERRHHAASSSVAFECDGVVTIGNDEFRAVSGKVNGVILCADTLQYENGVKLSRDEQENLKCLYQHFVLRHEDFIDGIFEKTMQAVV